jgi:hypothetical protein
VSVMFKFRLPGEINTRRTPFHLSSDTTIRQHRTT